MNKEPWEWDITDVQRLIVQKEKESAYLEYKACGALRNNDKSKNEISKDVSAFANAGRGTIIYGIVEEDGIPLEIDEGFAQSEIDKEWLDQVISSRIRSKIDGVKIHPIPLDNVSGDRVIYLVSIPQSRRAPHQAWDKKFYTRRNFLSEPMEEYEIRDLFMREDTPYVTLDMFFRRHGARIEGFPLSVVNPKTLHNLKINGVLKNEGGGVVRHALITLYIHGNLLSTQSIQKNTMFRPLKIRFEDGEEDVYRVDINWDEAKMPLFKNVGYRLFDTDLMINFMHPRLEKNKSPFIMWEVHAPRMEPNRGFLRLKVEKGIAKLKQEDVPKIFTIMQNGRGRTILETPDLSFDAKLKEIDI